MVWHDHLTEVGGGCQQVGPHVLHDADVKGHIFDVDGTLIDTMPGFLPSWYTVSAEKGMKMTDELFYCCAGLPLADVVRRVYQANGRDPPTDEDIQDFLQKKRAERERSEAETGPPPGRTPFTDFNASNSNPLSQASSA